MNVSRNVGMLAVLFSFTCLCGCATLPASAVQRIREADRAYQTRRYGVAEKLLDPVIGSHGDKPDVAEALYLRGLCRLRTDRPAEARADLDRALYLARRNDLIDRLHTQLGNIEFDNERYNRAAVYYEHAYDDLPNRPPKDRVGYQYGVALQRLGRFADARSVLNGVAGDFPGSDYAASARRKAAWRHDYFAIQCGAYRKIGGAHNHARSLKNQGIDAIAQPDDSALTRRYVVRVGRYNTFATARQALPRVLRFQPDAFIVP